MFTGCRTAVARCPLLRSGLPRGSCRQLPHLHSSQSPRHACRLVITGCHSSSSAIVPHPAALFSHSPTLSCTHSVTSTRMLCCTAAKRRAGRTPSSLSDKEADAAISAAVRGGTPTDVAALPPFVGDPAELPMERDPSVSAYSTGSADILGGGPNVNKVSSFGPTGFVVNDQRLQGSVALLPRLKLLWNVTSVNAITPASLSLITLASPPIELLVVGTGDKMQMLPRETMQFLKDRGIAIELLATRRACATYNFLSSEGRRVAAVLLPPSA